MSGYAPDAVGAGDADSLTKVTVRAIAFTDHGMRTGEQIRAIVPQLQLTRCPRGGLAEWTAKSFADADVIIYIGATGIAVRAIAVHIASKLHDPAVLVIDELGSFVIPILSGHVGGANAAAAQIADALGATAVITTATDLNHRFAIDVWAVQKGLAIRNKDGIRTVSSRVLAGQPVYIYSRWPIEGTPPDGVHMTDDPARAHAIISYCDERPASDEALSPLCLTPRCLYIGIGCRRGTPREAIEAAWAHISDRHGLYAGATAGVTSIDIKADEAGLLEFCRAHRWSLTTYTAEELNAVEGDFHGSEFVKRTVGVDSVCERSCVLAAHAAAGSANEAQAGANDGSTAPQQAGTAEKSKAARTHGARTSLLVPKTAGNGVTIAVAIASPRLYW